jgi:hypothetical protein
MNPVGLHEQHAVGPGLQCLGVAGMPVAGLDQHHAARAQCFGAIVVQKQGLALIHDAYGVLGMRMQPVAVAGLAADAQLGPGQGRVAVEMVAGGWHDGLIMPAC